MKKFIQSLDPVYVKVGVYASGTVLITGILAYILYCMIPQVWRLIDLVSAVLKPILVGFVIWYLLLPSVNRFDRKLQKSFPEKKWTRPVTVMVIMLLIVMGIVLFLILVSQTFVSQIDFKNLLEVIQKMRTDAMDFAAQITTFLEKFNIKIPNIGSSVSGFVGSVANGATTIFFGVIFSIYFMLDGERLKSYWKNVVEKIFTKRTINKGVELLKEADHCFSGYIRGQMIDAVFVGVLISILFTMIRMKYPLVVGLLAGFGNLIPYVGPALGYIGVILVNLISGDIRMLIIGLVILQIVMMIDGNIINPRLLAGSIQIHPLLVIASLIAGGAIGGLLGMVLAVPIGAFLKLQFDKWLKQKQPPVSKEE